MGHCLHVVDIWIEAVLRLIPGVVHAIVVRRKGVIVTVTPTGAGVWKINTFTLACVVVKVVFFRSHPRNGTSW